MAGCLVRNETRNTALQGRHRRVRENTDSGTWGQGGADPLGPIPPTSRSRVEISCPKQFCDSATDQEGMISVLICNSRNFLPSSFTLWLKEL